MENRKPPTTPVFLKRSEKLPWPEKENAFYVLSRDGLFICRNHPFFKSCVRAPTWPTELAPQERFLVPRYPKLSREHLEVIVGFFSRIADLHNSEAAVLLVWDACAGRVNIVVPHQVATVRPGWNGGQHPVGLHYYPPTQLGQGQFIFGDVHSHVTMSAYASATDVADEAHQPGLHIVVGRIDEEPPEFHIEAVVDGERFELDKEEVLEGYERRRLDMPGEWVKRVRIRTVRDWYSNYYRSYRSSSGEEHETRP